jgi:glycosyltransferase involved in cell wall biosynthesis
MKKKIAFIYIWSNPPIRKSVEKMLVESFPEYEVESIGIGKLLKRRLDWMLLNELSVMWYYGMDILTGKKKHGEYIVATPYLFHKVRQMIVDLFKGKSEDYSFTFQLQSLFDTSVPGIPNFIYTDRTDLANLAYRDFDPNNLYAPAWIKLESEIYNHASLVFTRSKYIAKSLVDDYQCPPEKPVLVFSGSNISPYNGKADPDRYSRRNILFVGVNWELKGGPELEEAFRVVLKSFPEATLTIIGSSPKMHLKRVQILGYLPATDLPPYYERASIFCLPTKKEAFGVSFIEAMDYGLPVVATNLGAIPDFIVEGQNGHLVPPGDAHALADALLDLLADPQKCQTYGEKSREICQEKYNWTNSGKLIREHIFKSLGK